MRKTLMLLCIAASLSLGACDPGSRAIAGRFRVRQVVTGSDTAYYLWDTARPENEVSTNGQLVRLGSDAHKLVALFTAPPSSRGFAAGWTAFDLDGNAHSAAMTDDERRQHPDLADISTYRADSAWARANGHKE